jgi:hypothetical protein
MTIKEYLEVRRAIGKKHAISTQEIMGVFHIRKRAVTELVAKERSGGALICATTTKGGGYFLPANADEVLEQEKTMTDGIKLRAASLRPFRAFKEQREAKKKAAMEKAAMGNIFDEADHENG